MPEANDHSRLRRADGLGLEPAGGDAGRIVALYESHGRELRRFVLGITRDPEAADDVLQASFAKAIELGHTVRAETFKGWLFRVAFHEALEARRRRQGREQGYRRLAALGMPRAEAPEDDLVRGETVESVRRALAGLPEEQRRVVWARMYEDKTFAEIASESGLPLGTVLTRMRLALEKLRRSLRRGD